MKGMKIIRQCLLMLTVTAGAAFANDAIEVKHTLKPGILTGNGDWTLSLGYDVGLTTELWSQPRQDSFRKYLNAHIRSKGTVAIDPDINNEPLAADAGITTGLNLYVPPKVTLGDKPGEYHTDGKGSNYGRLSFSLLGGYETDQQLDNRNITLGGELGYVLTENEEFKALIPSLFLGYDVILTEHSKLQRNLGVDDDNSRRFRIFASWKLPVGSWISDPLDPLNAHFDLRYYLSDGLAKAFQRADRDDAVYVAGGLSYSFPEPAWGILNSVFVRVANGRIPPVSEDATTVTFGVGVWEK